MALTFNYVPEWGSKLDQEPKVITTKFGDGYEIRSPDGINNNPEKWTVQFTMGTTNAAAALAFIQDRNGVEAFWWKNPFEVTKLYKCSKWGFSRQRGYNVLNMTFEQVFESAT